MLGAIGPAAGPAVDKLIRLLQDKNQSDDDRWWVAIKLGEIGPPARKAVPILIQILETESSHLQNGAVNALGDLGHNDKRVVPVLVKALDNKDASVSVGAVRALGNLGEKPERAIPAHMRFLSKHRRDTNYQAARILFFESLRRFGTDAKCTLVLLVSIIKDDEETLEIRKEALLTLRTLGPEARKAIPVLKELLKQEYNSDGFSMELEKVLGAIERSPK